MRLAVDLSSILWTTLRTGKDAEGREVEFEGELVWVNSAASAYEKAVNSINAAMHSANAVPEKIIIVEEGMNSKRRRLMIDSSYKANRGNKPQEENLEFQKLRDMVVKLYMGLGAIKVSQEGVEGDDVLGWLAANSEEDLRIHTFDGDLLVLHGRNAYGANIEVRIKGEVGVNKYGPFNPSLIGVYKATVGDTSDGIKGCPGFGKGAFQDLYGIYGEEGLFELRDMLEAGSLAPLNSLHGKCKVVTKLLDNEAAVVSCYKLAKIHAEWVNTINSPLVWEAGMVKAECRDERLKSYRQQRRLITNDKLLSAYDFLKSKLAETSDFPMDIETSQCQQADDWLEAQGKDNGVDVLSHRLTGFSITFGCNHQYTFYFSVNHRDTDNIALTDARIVLELVSSTGKPWVIQNTSFEGAVLALEEDEGKTWAEHWKDNGYRGFLPNWLDTLFESSYLDENERLGLKERSKLHLGYAQATFLDTVCKTGAPNGVALDELNRVQDKQYAAELARWNATDRANLTPEDSAEPPQAPLRHAVIPTGGKVLKVLEWGEYPDPTPDTPNGVKRVPLLVIKQYKMNELTAEEVFDYGTDDTICTAGLHNFYKLVMQLEHTWQTYLQVEIDASYQHVKNFLDGKNFSLETMKEQEKIDDKIYDDAWATLRAYLIQKGWAGTVAPAYTKDITAKEIKEAYKVFFNIVEEDDDEGEEDDDGYPKLAKVKDPFLSTRVRTPAKLVSILESLDCDTLFVEGLKACLVDEIGANSFTAMIRTRFSGEPAFKISNKQMGHLLYGVMGLPIRIYNKPTPKMRKEGLKQGAPMTNSLAIKYAMLDATPEQVEVLKAIQLIQMVKTRRGLYYTTYPNFIHWKTGRIHSYHRQCATNTRRASSAAPNEQQMPKHPKIEGQASRFRECVVPHKPNAVVVSLDFSQQELRVIADYSRDPNMVACYVGDHKKDMHILTAVGIVAKQRPELNWSYAVFEEALKDKEHTHYKYAKEMRGKGKTTNFATEFGAMAPKLAQTMLVTEDEAQDYIDAKEEAFPEVSKWKESVVEEAKDKGYVRTKLGAVRHLATLLNSDDRWESSKAERQAVNFKVQGSSAEMTKLAEGRMWKAGLSFDYGAVIYGPIHDEIFASVEIESLVPFLKAMHACMVEPYADMRIPIESSISFGPNFGVQIEIGNYPTEEAINAGLAEMAKLK